MKVSGMKKRSAKMCVTNEACTEERRYGWRMGAAEVSGRGNKG